MRKFKYWVVSPDSSVILFLWLAVFEWFGSGTPQLDYLVRVAYLLILLQWLARIIKDRESFSIPKFVVPLLLILIQQIISVPTSPLPFHALEVVLQYLILAVGCLFLLDNLQHTLKPQKIENVIISMAVVFSLFNLLDILNWFRELYVVNGTLLSLPPFGYRLKGIFLRHPNLEAAFLNLVIPLVVVRIFRRRHLRQKLLWISLLGLFVIVDYFTSSRGGWLGAILGLGTMSFLLFIPSLIRKKGRGLNLFNDVFRSRRRVLAGILIIAVIILGSSIFIWQLNFTHHVPIVSARSDIWHTVWKVFLKNPLLGNGAGSMHILPAVEDQLPPGFYMTHAHNLLLQVAAENGILGVVLILVFFGLLLRTFYCAWRTADRNDRTDLAVYAGILVGVGIQNLVDFIFQAPIYLLCVFTFLILVYRQAPQSESLRLRGKLVFPIVIVLLVAYALGSFLTLHGSSEHNIGVRNVDKADWQSISDEICEAVEKNPHYSFYYFQCGLAQAYAYQESGEDAVLNSAISVFAEGLQMDPYWPIHWANLAALQWEAGQFPEALENMLRATNMAPRNATLALNLGRMYETSGQYEKAVDAYQQALVNDPWLCYSLFFTKTTLRSELAEARQIEVSSEQTPKQLTWNGWLLLDSNQPEQARQMFMQALQIKPDYGLAFSGLALVDDARGMKEQARIDAGTGTIADVNTPLVYLIAAQVAEGQGRSMDATNYLYLAYLTAKNHSYSKSYYGGVYHKWAFAFDLVPQVEDAVLTQEMREALFTLVDSLHELGQDDLARQVQDWVEENTP